MKKVAHICTSSSSHRILVDKLSMLVQKGYEVHLISAKNGYNEQLLSDLKIKPHFVKMNRKIHLKDDFVSLFKMIKLLKKEKFDIVHTHTAKAGIIGRIAAKLTKVPIIVHTSHGLPFYEGQKRTTNYLYKLFEKIGSFFCDAIASQNKEDMVTLQKMFPRKSIFYEGNGVDLNDLDKKFQEITEEELEHLKKGLKIRADTKIILVAARFEPVKDHYFLIEGLVELKKKFDNFVCVLAGDGPLREDISRLIVEKRLQNHTRLVGYQENIFPFIKMADIIALTSIKEGIPRIIMEAMSFSKPIVASDVLGTRELVQDKQSGVLVEYKNHKLLAAALHEVLENFSVGLEYGKKGRKLIEEKYNVEIVVDRLLYMYKELQMKKGLWLDMNSSANLPM